MAMIAFVDTETLGLDPDAHAVWEVGLVLFDTVAREVTGERLWQLRLTDDEEEAGDPIGMEIGRFAERYDRENLTHPWEFCREFASLTEGAHLAGNVVSFDEERLRRLCRRHEVKHGWHYHLIDVENIAVGYLAACGQEVALPWKSDALAEQLGVTVADEDRHTALGDARWALDTYLASAGVS